MTPSRPQSFLDPQPSERPQRTVSSAPNAQNESPSSAPLPASWSLLANADSTGTFFDGEMGDQRKIASDSTQPLTRRLEAFEDIIDSELGDTNLTRARNVEREAGLRQIFLKFEGGNPTGTQKDRIAFAQAMDALRRGFDAITVATCGNYGAATALAASMAGLGCIIYIPEGYHAGRVEEMTSLGAEIVRAPGDYEEAVLRSRARAQQDEIYDANPGGANTSLQLMAYGQIATEIYDELRDAPAAVAVPVSNGRLWRGSIEAFSAFIDGGRPLACLEWWPDLPTAKIRLSGLLSRIFLTVRTWSRLKFGKRRSTSLWSTGTLSTGITPSLLSGAALVLPTTPAIGPCGNTRGFCGKMRGSVCCQPPRLVWPCFYVVTASSRYLEIDTWSY